MSGRMASIGISDVVIASVYSEKTSMKKLMMMKMIIIIIIIITVLWINRKNWRFFTDARNKGQRSDGRLQIWCSIQLSLHKEPTEVGLVKKLTGSLYWWVEQCVPTLHRESYRTLWLLLWINCKKRRFFHGRQKKTSAMKQRPEKWW